MEGGMQDNAGSEADCSWTIIWCAADADVLQVVWGLSARFMSFFLGEFLNVMIVVGGILYDCWKEKKGFK